MLDNIFILQDNNSLIDEFKNNLIALNFASNRNLLQKFEENCKKMNKM